MPSSSDILIVGAGPTGLTLACTLASRGVRIRIIDAAPSPPAGSRGKGLQPRSLELLDDLGIVDRVVGNGRFDLPIRMYDDAGQSMVQDLYAQRIVRDDVPYATPLLTPQWRVEEALRAHLEALGGKVEFGTMLTDFVQEDGGVTARVDGGDGPATIRARWLVGCDGGKSVVRRRCGIAFLGETLETHRMLLGDVRVDGLDRDHWHMWKSASGFLALCPLPSTDGFQLQASCGPDDASEPSLALFQHIVDTRAQRDDIRLSDASWLSLWRCNIRMVDRYRDGQVFLAGDAAHVHSPAGGQGMNTGIQDAYNLGWKMAAVLGGADAALLDTYQDERLPIAAGVLGISTRLMEAATNAGKIVFRRDDQTLQLGLGYRGSSLTIDTRADGEGLRAGDRAPDASGLVGAMGARRMFDLLRGPQVTLLGFGSRWRSAIDQCDRLFGPAVRGVVIGAPAGENTDYVDSEGHARAAYADDTLFVVRPDNYIGMATGEPDAEAIVAYLRKLTARH